MITPACQNPNAKVGEAAPSPVGFKNVPATESPKTIALEGYIPEWIEGVMYRSGMLANRKSQTFSALCTNSNYRLRPLQHTP